MRSFVAVIAITSIVGIVTARQEFAVGAGTDKSNSTIGRISDIAARPLQYVIPTSSPLPPKPPVNLRGEKFVKDISAEAVIAIDHVTDEVLFEKNSDTPRSLASITKLMSALIIAEHISDWSATTTISVDAVEEGNQTIVQGEIYTIEDLYNAALVGSFNTAVNALVHATGMSQDEFVAEMNRRAHDLGMESMAFVEPTGLSPLNIGSARDVAQLTKIALSHPRVKITSMHDRITIKEMRTKQAKVVKATDWLLTQSTQLKNAHVEGGKTGYIPEAGFNFTVQIKNKEDREIRIVVMGAKDVYARFTEAADVANWVYDNYAWPEK